MQQQPDRHPLSEGLISDLDALLRENNPYAQAFE